MFGSHSNAELGLCPDKVNMYYYGAMASDTPFMYDRESVACDRACTGVEYQEKKFLWLIPYEIEVCPLETPVSLPGL